MIKTQVPIWCGKCCSGRAGQGQSPFFGRVEEDLLELRLSLSEEGKRLYAIVSDKGKFPFDGFWFLWKWRSDTSARSRKKKLRKVKV